MTQAINIAAWAAMKARRATKKEMAEYYAELKGYPPFECTKPELIDLIDTIISERNRKAYEEHREENSKVPFTTGWASDNAEVSEGINAIFKDMPPIPLYGD